MYCVTCGSPLKRGNQVGLVCLLCKQMQEKKRRSERRPLTIHYCFRCGNPYHPHDASIQHDFCEAEQATQPIKFELRQHALKKMEG